MRIGVLGTGTVGRTLGTALVQAGHDVLLGSRSADSPAAVDWAAGAPGPGSAAAGTFAAAAAHGEVVVNATNGAHSLDALATCDADSLAGKVLLDVANPLDFSTGTLRLTVCNDDSLAEQIARAHPQARVVKTLNTVNAAVMVAPRQVPGPHHVFVAGDDAAARARAVALLGDLGWPSEWVLDLGGLDAARGLEMYLPLWLRLYQTFGTPDFNITVARP